MAEIKAQVLEMRNEGFVAGRVEEATGAQRSQAEAVAKQLKRAREEAEVLRAELGDLEESLAEVWEEVRRWFEISLDDGVTLQESIRVHVQDGSFVGTWGSEA